MWGRCHSWAEPEPKITKIMALSLKDRVHGSLLGLAVCDAVGTAVEFMPPGSFEEVTDMIGGGKFSLQPGQVSPPNCMDIRICMGLYVEPCIV